MFRKIMILSISLFVSCAALAAAGPACAAESYTIKEMTPQVTSALENRRNRFDKLTILKQQGKIGENNRGYMEAFTDETEVTQTVAAENADRRVIYETIAQQNNLSGALATIEKVFAET